MDRCKEEERGVWGSGWVGVEVDLGLGKCERFGGILVGECGVKGELRFSEMMGELDVGLGLCVLS